eukprot:gene5838-8055_t
MNNYENHMFIITELNTLKAKDIIRKWNCTNIQPYKVAPQELLLVSRQSFITPTIIESQLTKNIFGLFGIFFPFIFLIVQFLFPNLNNRNRSINDNSIEKERIIYHEAGHFLAGYLCGVLIEGYDVTGQRDAGLVISTELPLIPITSNNNNLSEKKEILFLNSKIGSLLIVSMAGIVAETLRFGESKGGIMDLSLAKGILYNYDIKNKYEVDSYLRWAVLKALVLLKLHRDELDEISEMMRNNQTVMECMKSIEFISTPS